MDSANADFFELIKDDDLTVIDFSAKWCMHCRTLTPILDRIAEKLNDVAFYELDIDECEDIAKQYKIFSVPTLVCFKEGKMIDSLVGICPADEIISFIKKCQKVDVSKLN